uniref:Uncharacterized protein n=1 Tax=Arion vulgaris TaxID=1028688 RepID=A0A0B7A306_9EUPU
MKWLTLVVAVHILFSTSVTCDIAAEFKIGFSSTYMKTSELDQFQACLCNDAAVGCSFIKANNSILLHSKGLDGVGQKYVDVYVCILDVVHINCTRRTDLQNIYKDYQSFRITNRPSCSAKCIDTKWNRTNTIRFNDSKVSSGMCPAWNQSETVSNSPLSLKPKTIWIIVIASVIGFIVILVLVVVYIRCKRKSTLRKTVKYTVNTDASNKSVKNEQEEPLYFIIEGDKASIPDVTEQTYSDPKHYAKLHENTCKSTNLYDTFPEPKEI